MNNKRKMVVFVLLALMVLVLAAPVVSAAVAPQPVASSAEVEGGDEIFAEVGDTLRVVCSGGVFTRTDIHSGEVVLFCHR